jgi:hypothetical protein
MPCRLASCNPASRRVTATPGATAAPAADLTDGPVRVPRVTRRVAQTRQETPALDPLLRVQVQVQAQPGQREQAARGLAAQAAAVASAAPVVAREIRALGRVPRLAPVRQAQAVLAPVPQARTRRPARLPAPEPAPAVPAVWRQRAQLRADRHQADRRQEPRAGKAVTAHRRVVRVGMGATAAADRPEAARAERPVVVPAAAAPARAAADIRVGPVQADRTADPAAQPAVDTVRIAAAMVAADTANSPVGHGRRSALRAIDPCAPCACRVPPL